MTDFQFYTSNTHFHKPDEPCYEGCPPITEEERQKAIEEYECQGGFLYTAPPRRIEVGDVLVGFCGGWFGRDSYGDKTVLHVGRDYVVVSEMHYWGPDSRGPIAMIHVAQSDYRDENPSNPRLALVEHLDGNVPV